MSEEAEKQEIIKEILELQSTLRDLSQKVEQTRDEQTHLAAENEVLVKYISNLMEQYGTNMDTSKKTQPLSVTGKLKGLFGRSNATSNNIPDSINALGGVVRQNTQKK